MPELLGQVLGVLVTLLCIVCPLMKRKWHMLILSVIVNLMAAANLLLLGQIGSAIAINLLAVIQLLLAMWHYKKEIPATRAENVLFLVLYIGIGLAGALMSGQIALPLTWRAGLEMLPILAVTPFCIAVFVRDEQKTRLLNLVNAAIWIVYYGVIGSTVLFAQIVGLAANLIALIKYRKKTIS